MNPYIPLLILFAIGLGFALVSVGTSLVVGPARYNAAKAQAYECGIQPTPQAAEALRRSERRHSFLLAISDRLRAPGTTDAILSGVSEDVVWGDFEENTACGLCYTSGTTGNPKGVLYSHRSNFLHTFMGLQATVMGAGLEMSPHRMDGRVQRDP